MEILGNQEIPIGFSMALARDSRAMNAFSSMPEQERNQIIEASRSIQNKHDMDVLVNRIIHNKTF